MKSFVFLLPSLICVALINSTVSATGFTATAFADSTQPEIIMGKGEQRVLKVPPTSRFAVGGNIIRAHYDPKVGLLIKAVGIGQTDVILFLVNGQTDRRSIRVESMEGTGVSGPLLKQLSRLEETSVYLTSKGAILKGSPKSFSELERIAALSRGFDGFVWDETTPPENLVNSASDRIQKILNESKLPCSIESQRILNQLVLTGECSQNQAREAILKKVRSIYPLVRDEIQFLSSTVPTIHFKVYLLQVKQNAMSQLGVAWPGQIPQAFSLTSQGLQSKLGVDLSLHALEGEGKLKVISRPELVVRAPGEAELFAGGELPIRIKTQKENQVYWRNFGVRLKLKVEQSTGSRVRLDISSEVSDLDHSIKQDEIPGIQSNRMNTQVDAQFGKPLFLSGLLQESQRTHDEGVPFLSRIPFIGGLFGTHSTQEEKVELVAILVPGKLPPQISLQRFAHLLPDGPLPAPRNHITPDQEQALRDDPEFPWNVL